MIFYQNSNISHSIGCELSIPLCYWQLYSQDKLCRIRLCEKANKLDYVKTSWLFITFIHNFFLTNFTWQSKLCGKGWVVLLWLKNLKWLCIFVKMGWPPCTKEKTLLNILTFGRGEVTLRCDLDQRFIIGYFWVEGIHRITGMCQTW